MPKYFIISTNFARGVSSKVLFMEQGAVIESGPSRDFFEHPKTERSRAFVESILRDQSLEIKE